MERKTINIDIPNNLEIDWEESKKQNKIVLKDKQLTYEDVCKKLFSPRHFYTDDDGTINKSISSDSEEIACPNNALTEHQLECLLAKNMLANIAVYLNDGWKPSGYIFGCFICTCGEELEIRDRNDYKFNNNIIFKSKKIAQQAIEILGEETVKLALKPLGI